MKITIKLKKYISTLCLFAALILLQSTYVYAASSQFWETNEIPETRLKERLFDDAALLSTDEETEILGELNSISEKQRCNVVILTVDSHPSDITSFADDYFDYNGFGADYDSSGILFVLSMDTREWAISTSGEGIQAFTDYGQTLMTDDMLPYLKEGDYFGAFKVYISTCDTYLDSYHQGSPVDYNPNDSDNHVQRFDQESSEDDYTYDAGFHIIISIIIGFIAAFLPIFVMKSKLRTVRINNSASQYRSHEGLNLTVHNDIFLRSNVTRTKRIENNDSRGFGGSSFHTSSSGSSHGGSHGSF